MKSYKRSVRFNSGRAIKKYYRAANQNGRQYGITNWIVGSSPYPWNRWIQLHIGYSSIQIKYYLIIIVMCLLSFAFGLYLK